MLSRLSLERGVQRASKRLAVWKCLRESQKTQCCRYRSQCIASEREAGQEARSQLLGGKADL